MERRNSDSTDEMMLEVTDDSGFLALIDPDAYVGFVDEDWTLDQLIAHFKAEMNERRLLLWGTGLEGWWRVEVATSKTDATSFREIVGPITTTKGRLLVTNYESLTMAAQAPEVTLPQQHEIDQLVDLPAATYHCRVLQRFDPEEDSMAPGDGPDFVIELLSEEPIASPWSEIPWSEF